MRRRVGGLVGLGARRASRVGGCLPAPATQEARAIAELYTIFMAIAAIVAVIVLGLATFAILRYRGGAATTTLPPQVHGDLRFEAVWTIIPILTIVGLLVLTVVTLHGFDAVVERADPPASRSMSRRSAGAGGSTIRRQGVVVEGVTPDGPELVVPVGENVHVTLTGNDVVHAFFVPQFLFKRDAIPGRLNVFGVHGRRRPARTAASAPSSAASTTPGCRSPCVRSRAPSTTRGWRRAPRGSTAP